jgi:arylsulfatase A-like enzyme
MSVDDYAVSLRSMTIQGLAVANHRQPAVVDAYQRSLTFFVVPISMILFRMMIKQSRYLFLLILALAAKVPATEATQPNVVVILADDLGWGDLSCYPKDPNNPDAAMDTPHLDQLAAQGVKFTQAYAQTMCTPSRAMLLTGRFPQRFGFDNLSAARFGIPKTEKTLAELLKEHGYATACIGKWHVGLEPGARPLERGFDRFYGFLGPAHDYFDPALGVEDHGPMVEGVYVYDQDKPVKEMKYITDQLTDEAIDFIERSSQKSQPFFLYLPYNAPHGPVQPPLDTWADFEKLPAKEPDRNRVRACEDNIDHNVGRLLKELSRLGLEDQTIVVFSSDNGGNEYETRDGEIRTHAHNGGLRGCKFSSWEGGFRVPLLIRWPGRFPADTTFTQPVSLVDIYATAAAAASIELPASPALDSVDLLPYVTGAKSGAPHDVLHASNNTVGADWSVRRGDWKLVSELAFRDPQDRESVPRILGLYHMAAEVPQERENLIDKHPEIAAELRRIHDEYVASCPPSLARQKAMEKARKAKKLPTPVP